MISVEYAAGFFDGEGSVYAATRRKTPEAARSPTIIVCISNTNLSVLEAHKDRWGGSICERRIVKEHHQRQWQWVLCTRNARDYLNSVHPFLIIKKEVVSLALDYLALQDRPAAEKFDYSRVVFRNGRNWTAPTMRDDHREAVRRVFDAIRACNTRSAPSNSRRAYAA